ncbi:MAG: hypothetical protein FWD52_00195 [Candidatus Bathyarchaeota archaeon]|nr:hypothetical protein [Candidatus Termiticorpusculum sp.]
MRKILSLILLIFIICGFFIIGVNPVLSSELVEDSWNTKAPMSEARSGLGVVAVDGKIYAIGGSTIDGTVVGTNECYDPKTDTWTTLTAMPTPRTNFGIVAYQNKIYCIGGSYSTEYGLLAVEVYDTVTNRWSTKTSMPRRGGTTIRPCAIDGQIFFTYGGDLFMYDIAADSWIQKSSMPNFYRSPSYLTVVMDNKLVVVDAYNFGADTDTAQKVMIYDPKNDQWNKGQVDPHGGTLAVVTSGVYVPQRIYIIGTGYDFDTLTFYNSVYDPISNTWSTIKPLPTARDGFGVAVVDDVLYVIGGYTSDELLNHYSRTTPVTKVAINEQYVPSDYDHTAKTPEQFLSIPHKTTQTTFELNRIALITIGLTAIMTVSAVIALAVKRRKK